MSSLKVREVVWNTLDTGWTNTPWFDLSDYTSYDDIPAPETDPYVLVQFIGGTETMVAIAGMNSEDAYREDGAFYLHYVQPTGFSSRPALVQMEELRDLFKNKRFGEIVIESVDPFTDQENISIEVDGGAHGWSAICSYYTDICVS